MMKKRDMLILCSLRKDSRQKLTYMSRKIGIPVSTIYDRLKQFKNTIITKNTAIINFENLGYMTRVKVAMKTSREQRSQLKNFLLKHDNVNSVFKINNGYDFMAEVIFRNVRDLENFFEDIESKFKIEAKTMFYIVEDIIREAFLTDMRSIKTAM